MRLGERDIIERYFTVPELAFPRPEIELGPGDDAAVLQVPKDKRLVVSTDVLAAGVHFPENATADLIAHRALAVNLSDLAAMAAEPLCFTLGLTMPQADAKWLEAFSRGLAEPAREHRCALIGGDLSRGPLQVAIQVHGMCGSGRELRRSGARPGQYVYVTGWLGEGALGLASLGVDSDRGAGAAESGPRGDRGQAARSPSAAAAPQPRHGAKSAKSHESPESPEVAPREIRFLTPDAELPADCRAHFFQAYFRPRPRLPFALAAAPWIASAIDVSDGLLGDAGRLAAASGARIVLRPAKFPFSPCAQRHTTAATRIRAALTGGDDYELCFTADPAHEGELMAIAAGMKLPLTRVGEVTAGAGVRCEGLKKKLTSFDHFAGSGDD